MADIEFRTLGTLDLRRADGDELHSLVAQPKRVALLAYLCLANPRGFHRRDTLLGLFWPDADQAHARTSLRNALHVLRHTLGENAFLLRGDEEIAVNFDTVWCDSLAFEECVSSERVQEALELYRGDLLSGFFLEEVPMFERWLESERIRLRGHAARAARTAAEQCESDRNLTQALSWARRAVELADSDERAVRRLIELSARLGDRSGALQAYDNFARHLASEFEAEPSAETLALVERVRGDQNRIAKGDRAQTNAPVRTATGQQWSVPGYSIERELGRGGMATVLLARDIKHDRLVAVKVLRPDIAVLLGTERFLDEISIAAGLHHPNILPLFDSGQANGLPYYAMPYVEGETLRSCLRRERLLPVDDAIRITSEVAEAIGYAHLRGIIHRDIKPENILLENGHALVTDFGIARALSHISADQRTQAGLAMGTAAYMSPEQAEGAEGADTRSDIYSLGCVLYEMLAGDPPFSGTSAQAILARKATEPAPPLRAVRETVSPTLELTVLKALSRAPADRFRSMKEFVDALRRSPAKRASPVNISRALVAASAIGLVALAVWKESAQRAGGETRARLTDRALITNTGRVSHSAISPNGKTLAYVTTECRTVGCAYALELKEVDGSASRHVMDGLGELPPNGLEWSPDGSKILVNGRIGDQVGTFLISALGGVPRRLGPSRFSFWADGDSLLSPGKAPGDTLWILVSGLDGVPRDSIPIQVVPVPSPTDGITRILPIPKSRWIAVAVSRGIHTHWISIDRSGHIGDTLGIRPGGPPRASEDALWLGFPSSESSLRSIVRIPFDARSGRFLARQDTMFTGNWTAFDVTTDGGTIVFDEGASEFSGWALEMSDVVRGAFPEKRKLLTATSDLVFEVSPDGKRILVGRAAGPRPDGGRRWDILPFDGGPMTPLAATPSGHTAMVWSDSATIPVIAPTSKGIELALLDVNTSARRATYVVADSTMAEATSLAAGGWVWLPWAAREIKLHLRGEAAVRTLPFPPKHGHVESLAASPDGKKLLLVTTRAASRDTIRLNVMSLSDGAITTINSRPTGAAFAVWLADGSIMLAVWRLPDSGLTLYRLRESGETTWSATIQHPVWSISVSADMKHTALTVREYHGDASISRVVRD